MNNFQHIVVGGGISGLTAALLLGRTGKRVALVESFPGLAPTIRGFRRKGVYFETGVHLLGGLGDNHPLEIYFRHLGISDDLNKIPFDANGYDCFRFEQGNRQICMPYGYDKLHETLCAAFPTEKTAIAKYLDKIKTTVELSPFLNFKQKFSLESAVHNESCTLKDYLDSITDDKQLKDLLSYHTLLYGTPPEESMLSTHALIAGSYFISSHTVEGGGSAIVKAYKKQLEKYGVRIFCGQKVTSIRHNSDKEFESVILADDTELKANCCIWTGHPAVMIDCCSTDAFRPVFRRRIKGLQETTSALMLFGVANEPLPELSRKNLYLWPGGDYADILSGKSSLKQSAIFISAGQTTGKDTKQPVTAITSYSFDKFSKWADSKVHLRPAEYKIFKEKLSRQFEQECFKRCPELRGKVEFIDCATPLTLKEYCATPYGSMYGAAHTVSQYNPLPVTKIKGLFMAGQSIIAPGVLGAVVSAYLTCGIICGHDKIHEELRCIYNG